MDDLIKEAVNNYWKLSAKIIGQNRITDGQLTLEELCGRYHGEELDRENELFNCLYGNIYITVYSIYSPFGMKYDIGQTVEVFDCQEIYLRDLAEEEMER